MSNASEALRPLVSEGGDIFVVFSTVLNHVFVLYFSHWGLFVPLRMTVSHGLRIFIEMLVLNALLKTLMTIMKAAIISKY